MTTSLQELWAPHAESSATADAVYTTLREAIISGRLQPGDRLNEQQLAAEFGVSRTPVREALHRLDAEEFATRIPRGGMVVRGVTKSEVLEVYSVRMALDALAAREAALHATPADRAELRSIHTRMIAAVQKGDVRMMLKVNLQFHSALYASAHNGMLRRCGNQLLDWLSRFRETPSAQFGRGQQVVAEHERIVVAIESGNPADAELAAREHMEAACQVRAAMFEQGSASGSSEA